MFHPRKDENGQRVPLKNPSSPSSLEHWTDPESVAIVVPDGTMPPTVNNIKVESWNDHPSSAEEWELLADSMEFDEPELLAPAGLKLSAGVIVVEPDNRVWVVAPSNGFAGYKVTFPKGRLDGKSPKAAALVEAYEESGLRVTLLRHLIDVPRTLSYTRYYIARRSGGHPGDMGWESQAVLLAPIPALPQLLLHDNDKPIIAAINSLPQRICGKGGSTGG